MTGERVFEYSVFPHDPFDRDKPRIVWHTKGTVVGKRFWMTEHGVAGYYEICRGTYTGNKQTDDVIRLPINIIDAIWSA